MVFEENEALTPAGKPFAPLTPELLIPVAPVVVWVMLGLSEVFTHNVGVEEAALAVFNAVMAILAEFALTKLSPLLLTTRIR